VLQNTYIFRERQAGYRLEYGMTSHHHVQNDEKLHHGEGKSKVKKEYALGVMTKWKFLKILNILEFC
jgi:hypothetical protein